MCVSFSDWTGTFRLPLVHIMTLKVPMSTRHPCPSLKMWQLGKESLFLQIHLSRRHGGYKTQVWIMSLHSHIQLIQVAFLNLHVTWHCHGFSVGLHLSFYVTGAESWPPGVCLKYIGGDQFGHVNTVMVKSLDPQEISDVSVQMRSPTTPGMYQGQWRMCTATGLFYGGR